MSILLRSFSQTHLKANHAKQLISEFPFRALQDTPSHWLPERGEASFVLTLSMSQLNGESTRQTLGVFLPRSQRVSCRMLSREVNSGFSRAFPADIRGGMITASRRDARLERKRSRPSPDSVRSSASNASVLVNISHARGSGSTITSHLRRSVILPEEVRILHRRPAHCPSAVAQSSL